MEGGTGYPTESEQIFDTCNENNEGFAIHENNHILVNSEMMNVHNCSSENILTDNDLPPETSFHLIFQGL